MRAEKHVLNFLNSLDFERWFDKTENDKKWMNTYGQGFSRLEKLRRQKGENKEFDFDIVMANPPFAGDIKESRILHQYELGFNTVNDVNFSMETAHLAKNQILQQAATAMLAQANSGQQSLLQLIQG